MSLAELINSVIEEDGVTVSTIARRARLRRSTVYSWKTGTRGTVHAPAREKLRDLARGLRRPEAAVLAAAGLSPASGPQPDLGELAVVEIYRKLPQPDRHVAEQMLRALAARKSAQTS